MCQMFKNGFFILFNFLILYTYNYLIKVGVYRLMQLIKELCPEAVKEIDMKSYKDKSIAIDAYLTIYQYIIGTQSHKGDQITQIKDKDDNLTAHLLGIFHRSISLMENGVKPVWVFDGCPPKAKTETMKKRFIKKEDAKEKMKVALDEGDMDQALKYANRSTYVTRKMLDDAKKLIRLLGLPYIDVNIYFHKITLFRPLVNLKLNVQHLPNQGKFMQLVQKI